MHSQIPKLTAASEAAISDALGKVAALVNDGAHPNDAIVKVASNARIPAGHVRLMVRAFNNGRSVGHLKNANTLEQKAAAFDLADGAAVLERMFPSEFKTAAVQHEENTVSSDYAMPPTAWYGRREKAAHATAPIDLKQAWGVEKAADYPRQLRDNQALSRVREIRRDVESLRHSTIKLAYDVAHAVDSITDYFRRADSLPFAQVHDNVKITLGGRGDRLMQKLAGQYPTFCRKTGPPHNCDWSKAPYSLIKVALARAAAFNMARQNLEIAEEKATKQAQETLRPFVQRPVPSVITGSVWGSPLQAEKQAGLAGVGMGAAIGSSVGNLTKQFRPKSKEELVQDRMRTLGSAEHEQRLRAIQARAMLHDLMLNDPVISGYPEEQVLDAYNQISQMAPRAVHRRLMAQSLLRKYLEQGAALDPFDVDQLMDVERKLRGVGIDEDTEKQPKVESNAASTV